MSQPFDVADFRRRHDLTQEQLGHILGQRDDGRSVRSWEAYYRTGDRHGPSRLAIEKMREIEQTWQDYLGCTDPEARALLWKRLPEIFQLRAP